MVDDESEKLKKVSQQDVEHLRLIRANVGRFVREFGKKWGSQKSRLLDVAPHDHEGARPYFSRTVEVDTIDINADADATYCADICETNIHIPAERYDIVVCTEVLEHVVNPFAAIAELTRLLKRGGFLLASSPFNFRIHGPYPDCWRFTEHGWRVLLKNFTNIEVQALDDEGRLFMPIHYTVSAQKPSA